MRKIKALFIENRIHPIYLDCLIFRNICTSNYKFGHYQFELGIHVYIYIFLNKFW